MQLRAESHEILRFAVLRERLREVFGVAHVENLVSMPAVAAVGAVCDHVDSADLAESRAQGKDLEAVLIAGLARELSPAKRCHMFFLFSLERNVIVTFPKIPAAT